MPPISPSMALKTLSRRPSERQQEHEYPQSAQNPAKPAFMKRLNGVVLNAFTSTRARALLRATRCEMECQLHRDLSYAELGCYAGQAASTVFDKLQTTDHPQVESLLRWLERLPAAVRANLINNACRTLPTLEHPRLAHDPVQGSRLRSLICAGRGLVLITGGDDGARTFVAAALGHTCLSLEPCHRSVVGLDRYCPDWFVPVEGVQYLGDPQQALPDISRFEIRTEQGAVVILNGILDLRQGLLERCFEMAARNLVFVAEDPDVLRRVIPENLPPGVKRLHLSSRSDGAIQVRFL